jgi:hypothetical protein
MILVFLAGALVYYIIAGLVAAIVFMFTTVVGLILLGVLGIMFLVALLTPTKGDKDEDP